MSRGRFLLALSALAVFFAALQVLVLSSWDNSTDPSIEDRREAITDWYAAGPVLQEIACAQFELQGRDDYVFIDTSMDEGEKEAKLDLFEWECNQ